MVTDQQRLVEHGLVRAEEVVLNGLLAAIWVTHWFTDVEDLTIELLIGVVTVDSSLTIE